MTTTRQIVKLIFVFKLILVMQCLSSHLPQGRRNNILKRIQYLDAIQNRIRAASAFSCTMDTFLSGAYVYTLWATSRQSNFLLL